MPTSITANMSLFEQMREESNAMARYALGSGKNVSPKIMESLEAINLRKRIEDEPDPEKREGMTAQRVADAKVLGSIHRRLSDIVAPASPRTLLLLEYEAAKTGPLRFMGPVPLIRRLLLVAIFSVVALFAISTSPYVNGTERSFSLFSNSGWDLLLNELFLLTAASLGACFTNLFQASRYIKDGTFDPKFESTYWIRYVLGLMAGTILAFLIPLDSLAQDGGADAKIVHGIGKPTLAILGGFSASVVYRILNRLVTAIESLVKTDSNAAVAAREELSRARLESQSVEHRHQVATKLNALTAAIDGAKGDPDKIKAEIQSLQQSLISGDLDSDSVISAVVSKASTDQDADTPTEQSADQDSAAKPATDKA